MFRLSRFVFDSLILLIPNFQFGSNIQRFHNTKELRGAAAGQTGGGVKLPYGRVFYEGRELV